MDYDSTTITATFTAGSTSTTVNVPVIMDNIAERPEEFDLTLTIPSSLTGQVISGNIINAVGIITDNTSKKFCLFQYIYFTLLLRSYYGKIQ